MKHKLAAIASQEPERLAYIAPEESLTYGQLWQRASLAANRLRRQGTSAVVIYGHKEADVIVSILACLLAHRAYVPIDAGMPLVRIQKILEATGATLILSQQPLAGLHSCSLEALCAYDSLPDLEPDDPIAYIIFTSGSTGEPKGVPIPRSNLAHFCGWISGLSPLNTYKNIRVLNQASFSFDLSVADLYYALTNGHTLVALPGTAQQGQGIYDAFSRHDICVAVMTPTFMKLCLLDKSFNETNYPHFSCVYFCGEPLETQTVRKLFSAFPHIRIINAYGPTEATSAISAVEITQAMVQTEDLLPVGRMETLATPVEIDNGEIVLKGPSVFGGYLGGRTGGWFLEDGINCYRTGDLGYIREDYLYCKGRKDYQVKYKGYRIELADIEENIRRLPGVEDCAVVPAYTEDGIVKNIKAFVVGSEQIDAAYIKIALRDRLPAYMIPRVVKKLDRLPINQNGKTDRKALMQL